MAKFVVAGEAGCPSYARAEMLGDALTAQLPNFKLTKVIKEAVLYPQPQLAIAFACILCHGNGTMQELY